VTIIVMKHAAAAEQRTVWREIRRLSADRFDTAGLANVPAGEFHRKDPRAMKQ
jgi:hypothetical protein